MGAPSGYTAGQGYYPPGPDVVAPMFGFATRLLSNAEAKAPNKFASFMELTKQKFVAEADFSGMLCFEYALRELAGAALGKDADTPTSPLVVVHRACDTDQHARDLVLNGHESGKPFCVFENLKDRLPKGVAKHLDGMAPKPGDSQAVAEEKSMRMVKHLKENQSHLYSGC